MPCHTVRGKSGKPPASLTNDTQTHCNYRLKAGIWRDKPREPPPLIPTSGSWLVDDTPSMNRVVTFKIDHK